MRYKGIDLIFMKIYSDHSAFACCCCFDTTKGKGN